jgi:hypothetical protein
VGVGTEAEVLDGLTCVLGSAEKDGVGTGWGALFELWLTGMPTIRNNFISPSKKNIPERAHPE